MGKVKILSKDIYSKIQAGEIIEGPSSVIRELIDNSIDAKSKNIIVELVNSGIDAIVVKDDGEGIEKDDLKLVFKNHATSKISSEKDLKNIKTLGFRGEALYSIASVSRMVIKSKISMEDSGYMIKVYGGKDIDFSPISINNGTTVNVQDLFFNIPARKKFLNNSKKELNLIKKLFVNKAATNPKISFKLINNGKTIYNFFNKDSFFYRIKDILGESTYKYLKKLDTNEIIKYDEQLFDQYKINEFKLVFSSKDFYSKYRSFFLIIINGRPVVEDEIIKKIKGFYYSYLPRGFYPYFILNINLDPIFLDQNIDPTKNKIKIENDSLFAKKIADIIKKHLNSETEQFTYSYSNKQNYTTKNFRNEDTFQKVEENKILTDRELFSNKNEDDKLNTFSFDEDNKFNNTNLSIEEETSNNINHDIDKYNDTYSYSDIINAEKLIELSEINNISIYSKDFGEFKTILFYTYLLFEKDEELFLIDFHAAYERINYNKLKSNFKRNRRRPLLFPEIINLKTSNIKGNSQILKKIEILNENGFEIEQIGESTFQIISIPDVIKSNDEPALMEEIYAFLEDDELKTLDYEHLKEKVIARLACRMSPKAFDKLDKVDIKRFISIFNTEVENYNSCPHGRPTIIKIDKNYFDKKFYRTK